MAGHPPPNYGYGPPPPNQPPPYGGPPPNQPPPYGGPPPNQPYGAPAQPYGAPPAPYGAQPHKPAPSAPYGAPSAPYASPPPPTGKPPKEQGGSDVYHVSHVGPSAPPPSYGSQASGYPSQYQPYGQSPFASPLASAFPPGTDPNVVSCFQMADRDGSGLIDDKELQAALLSYNQSFSLRTVHLLMYLFTNSNSRKIGPKEFTQVFYSLQNWRSIFERFDRDRSGKIDPPELREALLSLGFSVSPVVLDLLVLKFDKSGGKNKAIEYDNFIECCLTVKGLTEKFKEKDTSYSGSATFGYEDFMLTVMPFLVA
uniref:EF-hand domain-containing protein n=1 Tax=Kalanchoe fedtschenkoi TaxID=63787 RepID=A0A7N0RAY2_KALFE